MPVIGWRKKGGRISELVANHLHSSPKRGRSLVVETGFPTSLIDLFVKNRDRFHNNNNNNNKNKNNNKKQKQQHHDQAHHHHDLVMLTSSQTPSPTPNVSVSISDSSNPYLNLNLNLNLSSGGTGTGNGNGNGIADEILSKVVDGGNNNKVVGLGDIDGVVDEVGGDATNGVLVCVIKMSLLVILALSTKKFAVGITFSALLLIFLEYLGKHVCKHFQKSLGGSLIQLVLGFLTIVVKRQKLVTQQNLIRDSNKSPVTQEESVVWGSSCSTEGGELNIPNEEIQILQPNCNLPPPIEEIQCVKLDEFQTLGGVDKKEDRFGCGVIEPKARQSRGTKIKSNIKKLVPKKLRSTKKKKRKDLENEETSSLGQDKVVKCKEQKQEADWERSSLFSSGRCCAELLGLDEDDEEQVEAVARTDVVENVVPKEGLAVERERLSETKRNTGYLIFFLIVLGGLVGGRVLALLLTLLWCFMIKSAAKFRRYAKVFVDWFPVKNL